MNRKELIEVLKVQDEKNVIRADRLADMSDRTLIYGYTCERATFHVYLKNKKIHTVVYEIDYTTGKPKNMREIYVKMNEDYLPDKRIYPERSDFDFCMMLAKARCSLLFTSWNEIEKKEKYYGFTLED